MLTVGVGLFVYNIARTLLRVPRWNVIATAVASALGWLSLAVCAGLTIAVGKCSLRIRRRRSPPATHSASLLHGLKSVAAFTARFDQIGAMHAHAHLGALGVFIMLIVGISYKLVPMFTLSDIQSRRRAAASVALLNAGLLGSFVTILLRHPLKFAFALVVVAGLACYGLEMIAILRARKRRTLDWGLKYFLTAISLLAPLSVLALVLSWPGLPLTPLTGQLENVYGFLALAGRRLLRHHRHVLQDHPVPGLVWQLQPANRPEQSPVPGGPLFARACKPSVTGPTWRAWPPPPSRSFWQMPSP